MTVLNTSTRVDFILIARMIGQSWLIEPLRTFFILSLVPLSLVLFGDHLCIGVGRKQRSWLSFSAILFIYLFSKDLSLPSNLLIFFKIHSRTEKSFRWNTHKLFVCFTSYYFTTLLSPSVCISLFNSFFIHIFIFY